MYNFIRHITRMVMIHVTVSSACGQVGLIKWCMTFNGAWQHQTETGNIYRRGGFARSKTQRALRRITPKKRNTHNAISQAQDHPRTRYVQYRTIPAGMRQEMSEEIVTALQQQVRASWLDEKQQQTETMQEISRRTRQQQSNSARLICASTTTRRVHVTSTPPEGQK